MSTARLRPSAAERAALTAGPAVPEGRAEVPVRPQPRAAEPEPRPRGHARAAEPEQYGRPRPRAIESARPAAPEPDRPRTRAEERAAREAAERVSAEPAARTAPRTRAEERAAREAAEREAAERDAAGQRVADDRRGAGSRTGLDERAARPVERAEARGRARPGVAPASAPPAQRAPQPRAEPVPRAEPAQRAQVAQRAEAAQRAQPAQRAETSREPDADPDRDVVQGSHRRDPRIVLELRVVAMVVRREFKKYFRSKAKILSSFVQPFFFLLIFGYGMRTLVRTTGGASFEQFVFPGVIAMTVLGRALLSAVTIVQDREFGFLREMLVSPASRVSIVIGSILGGAGISTIQAVLLFFGAPVMGLFPGPAVIAKVLATTALMAVEVTALGVALATFIQKPNSFTAVTQALTYPMLVLSGALVPLAGLPSWVAGIARFNLFSYPVDATRRLLIGSDVKADQGSLVGLVLFGHPMTVMDEIALTAGCTVVFVLIAAWRFARVA